MQAAKKKLSMKQIIFHLWRNIIICKIKSLEGK